MICASFKDQAQQVGIPARPDFNKLFFSYPLLWFFTFKSDENDQIIENYFRISMYDNYEYTI